MSDKFIQSVKVVKTTGVADKRPVGKPAPGVIVCNKKTITEKLCIRDGTSRTVAGSTKPTDKK